MEREALTVIVAYRNTSSLVTALDSLGPREALVVVDNGTDAAVRELVERHGGLYITLGRNVGFAAAVNIALAERDGRDVLLLNPDARATPDLPAALSAVLAVDRRIAAVAPRLVDAAGRAERVAWPVPSPSQEWIDGLKLRRFFPSRELFLVGAVLLLRSEALDDVGAFDERFFLYAEECDWQLRALRLGWEVKVAEGLSARHDGGGSSEQESLRERYFYESGGLFARKWYGRRGQVVMRAGSLAGTFLRLVASLPSPDRRARYARQLRL